MERVLGMANLITILRFPLLVLLVFLLYSGNPTVVLCSIALLIIVILMDSLDGIVARRRGETSLLGSALDIAADRALETVLWVVFANLGLISVAIPIIVIMRGVLVDAIRAVGIGQGIPPFKQLISPLSRFLVSSPVMRSSYGVSKTLAFVFLMVDQGLTLMNHPWAGSIHLVAVILSWIAVFLCCTRGIPVLVDGAKTLQRKEIEEKTSSRTQPAA
jgi:CDP-diacylglycerol---glycerol-3-phosphate 3-phosphatidyltransferase